MSDDEDITYVRKTQKIHYGSLEESERLKQQQQPSASQTLDRIESDDEDHDDNGHAAAGSGSDAADSDDGAAEPRQKIARLTAGSSTAATSNAGGNINTSNEYFDLEQEVTKDKVALLEEFERRRKARQINVSTDDVEVRKNLRHLNEPVCLFGEGPAERRRRLKDLLSNLGENAIKQRIQEEEERKQLQKEQETTWYHEGPEALRTARFWLAYWSLPRARQRLQTARELLQLPSATRAGRMVELQKRIQSLALECSQVGDTRPISNCAFSDDSRLLLTSSWSGMAKLWSVPDCGALQTLRGHACYVGGVAMRPGVRRPTLTPLGAATGSGAAGDVETDDGNQTRVVSMATSGSDGTVKLWSFGSEVPLADVAGHVPHRVAKVAFHPSGRFLGTACYDASWRLYDLEQKQEVLHQEGHAKAVHCLAFQSDGSVACTGGLDAFGRVWDLRTGRCVMFLEGHLGSVYGIDFSPNGYHIASASHDNTCKIWDLRRRQPVYTIPAHTNLVADVKYQKDGGNFLVTASYDSTTKIWSNKTWQPLKTLSGHDGKIMSVDIAANSQYIATTSFDRTFKLWAPEI